jgi:hypothetical protein
MRLRWSYIVMALLVLAMIPAVSAELSPLSYGFPTMFQSSNNIGFNKAIANAWDVESLNFSPFGTGGTSFGFGSLGCPVVSQSDVQGQSIMATEFAQSTQFTAFSYPAIDTSLGFAGFGIWP